MSDNTEKSSHEEMTFFDHVDALRKPLMRSAFVVVVVIIGAFFCKDFFINTILFGPQMPDFPTNILLDRLADITGINDLRINQTDYNMVNTVMAGQFNLHLKVSIITAIVVTVPYFLWEVWCFVRPALTEAERRGSHMFVVAVSSCFIVGLLFGYYIITPLTINFLANYSASPEIVNMIDVNSYLSTVINVSLACAALFQLPLLVYFLANMGLLTSAFMRRYRRHAIIVLVILSAIITPPDIFSLVLVVLPLLALYEFSIRIAARLERKKAAEAINESSI